MTPPVIELVRLPDHKVLRVLRDNARLRERLAALKLPGVEFLRVDIGEGVTLDGWCLKPPDFDPSKRYPILFYVYGEPAGLTVHDAWQGGRGLWHMMLAQNGTPDRISSGSATNSGTDGRKNQKVLIDSSATRSGS